MMEQVAKQFLDGNGNDFRVVGLSQHRCLVGVWQQGQHARPIMLAVVSCPASAARCRVGRLPDAELARRDPLASPTPRLLTLLAGLHLRFDHCADICAGLIAPLTLSSPVA